MPTRENFISHFSEKEAELLEAAAVSHENGINSTNKGDDPFKWVVCIILGYDCTNKNKKSHHLEDFDDKKFKEWIKAHGNLSTHNGDVDYLAMICGIYNEYM